MDLVRVGARPVAVTLDAAGTLLHPAEPIAATYARSARAHGHAIDVGEVSSRIRSAMEELSPLRQGDPGWRAYWREVVARAIGADDEAVLADLYAHFSDPVAWTISEGAHACLDALTAAGIRLGIISNWDVRLRPLLEALELAPRFHTIIVSAEVGLEKPDPRIFTLACERLGTDPARTLHVGDRHAADVEGARAAGCQALWYGHEVMGFAELCGMVLGGKGTLLSS